MIEHIDGKRVLFVTTKELDYIRNVQEIALIARHARSHKVIGSASRWYPVRLVSVWSRLLLARMSAFDTVFVGFAPQLVLPIFGAKFKKAVVVEDLFISFYDTLCCDRKKISPTGWAGRLLHRLDSAVLGSADAVVCDTRAHGRYFAEEFHVTPEKLSVLYLEADTSVYHPMEAVRPAHLQDKFIVLYFGSILPLQGIDVVLGAMEALRDCKELYFYCIGPLSGRCSKGAQPISDNIQYIRWLPQAELASYIAQADLCLAGHFNASVEKAKRTIPGKAVIYQAMKKPMILGDAPAAHELFSEDEDVLFVRMGDPRALADAIWSAYLMRTGRSAHRDHSI